MGDLACKRARWSARSEPHDRTRSSLRGALPLVALITWVMVGRADGWATPKGVELTAPSETSPHTEGQGSASGSPLDHTLESSLSLYPEARLSTWSDVGRVDWSERRPTVTGVGTPRLLSPTGGLATRELGELARQDALKRLARGLNLLQAQHSCSHTVKASDMKASRALGCHVEEALERAIQLGTPRRFSDGTTHLASSLSLRALTCPEPRARGGTELSIARLRGSPILRFEQLPHIHDADGAPIELSRLRFFRDHNQARSAITRSLKAKRRTLALGAQAGSFVLQGPSLRPDEELWVFIAVKGSPSAEASP